MTRAIHPVLTLEDFVLSYVQQRWLLMKLGAKKAVADVAIWLLTHKPVRASFRALMFNKPARYAEAQILTFNGVTVNTRFFGTVQSVAAAVGTSAETPRIVTV